MDRAFLGVVVLLCSGCATPQRVLVPHFDFSKIRRISVVPFEGQGGPAATDEFVRALVGAGVEVSDAHHPGDAILRGTVIDYKSNSQLMVFLGDTTLMTAGGQTVKVTNPLVSPGGSQITPEGTTLGTRNAQVVSVFATVAMNVTLIDPATKNGVWAGSASYEGLDMPNTLQATVDYLAKALGRVVKPPPKPLS